MDYQHLKIDYEGRVAWVTLDRAAVRNAMDERTLEELEHCFKTLGEAPKGSGPGCAVRVAVLRAHGADFCAGADIRWMKRAADYPPAKNRKDAERLVRAIGAVDECAVPVVAMVHGGVYGGGLGLIAACDVVIASADAKFCFSECRLGILPAVVSSFVLPKIGLTHTRRLYLTSEVFGAETARHIGLAHEVVAREDLEARARRAVNDVLKNGPEALRLAKSYIAELAALDRPERIKLSLDTLAKARSGAEAKEGLAAFLERRPPAWLKGC
ncbi:MAG: enoyl-CoA hydratase/isomerase family protein [Elusimicrobia bacterium]|nr:enoyl-CoA hydratase/isomerase family protein [Elusimicrobiota bacterium]